MKLNNFIKEFPEAQKKHGDLGDYIELKIAPKAFVIIYKREYDTELCVNDKFISFLNIKTPDDLKSFIKFFNND